MTGTVACSIPLPVDYRMTRHSGELVIGGIWNLEGLLLVASRISNPNSSLLAAGKTPLFNNEGSPASEVRIS